MTFPLFRSLWVVTCAILLSAQAASAGYCAALESHLSVIESGQTGPADPVSVDLGETSCAYGPATGDRFQNRFECVWTSSDENVWTADDARRIGQQLNSDCATLTANHGPGGYGEAYFLWYGNFTTVLIFVTDTGLKLTAQMNEEAYYWS